MGLETLAGLTVLIGGARSGKSALAVRLGRSWPGDVVVVATCPRIDGDDDLDARIAAHQLERPSTWRTIEEEHDLAGALRSCGDALVVVDCLTLWVSSLLYRGDGLPSIEMASDAALERVADRVPPTIVVTNEVGLGIVPADAGTRRYRDALGRVNQQWCAAADRSLFMAAGRAIRLGDPCDALADPGRL